MNIKSTISLFVLFFLFLLPIQLNAYTNYAFLFASIDKKSFLDPEYLYIDLQVNAELSFYNAIQTGITFDTNKLQLLESDSANSFCDIIVSEKHDNVNGNYDIICGSTIAKQDNEQIIRLKFKKLLAGTTQINFTPDSTLTAFNAQGSSIPLYGETHNIYLIK